MRAHTYTHTCTRVHAHTSIHAHRLWEASLFLRTAYHVFLPLVDSFHHLENSESHWDTDHDLQKPERTRWKFELVGRNERTVFPSPRQNDLKREKEKRKEGRKEWRERNRRKTEEEKERQRRRVEETEKEKGRKEGWEGERKEGRKERYKDISSFSPLFYSLFDSKLLGSYSRLWNCLPDMIGSLGFSRRQCEVKDAQGSSPNSKSRLTEMREQDVGQQDIPGKWEMMN